MTNPLKNRRKKMTETVINYVKNPLRKTIKFKYENTLACFMTISISVLVVYTLVRLFVG